MFPLFVFSQLELFLRFNPGFVDPEDVYHSQIQAVQLPQKVIVSYSVTVF